MNKKNKKGFTLTELIVVIVIIAILAAVMIPTYTGIVQKARKSADLQEAKNMNDALTLASVEKGTPKDMEEALSYLYEEGYVLENLNPTASGYNYLWNSKDNTIYYVDKDFNVSYPTNGDKTVSTTNGQSYWLPVAEPSDVTNYQDKGISFCLAKDLTADFAFTQLNNFDTNTFTLTGNISYGTATSPATVAGTVTVDGTIVGTLTVNDANLTVNHYGVIDNVNLIAVASASYDEYGTIKTKLEVKQGRAVIQSTGYVAEVSVPTTADTAVKVEVAGEVAKLSVAKAVTNEIKVSGIVNELVATAAVTVANTGTVKNSSESATNVTVKDTEHPEGAALAAGTTTGSTSLTLSIASLAELKDFRDQVNGGRTYAGITVNLTDDIDLTGLAWKPIGAFARSKTVAKGFAGTFNGNGHTITGLSNKGFAVNEYATGSNETTPDGQVEYVYGFFGCVANATIKDIIFSGVVIDGATVVKNSANKDIVGDSVAACVGYSYGNLTISGITVSGSIKAADGVGGVVGRAYTQLTSVSATSTISITNCTNNASVYGYRVAIKNDYSHVAGIVGYVSKGDSTNGGAAVTVLTGCTNNGAIESKSASAGSTVAGIANVWAGTLTVKNCNNAGAVTLVKGYHSTDVAIPTNGVSLSNSDDLTATELK